MKSRIKSTAFFVFVLFAVLVSAIVASVAVYAVSYHTIRINYVFADGTPASDPYVATYLTGNNVSLTVTSPNIDGYVPMTSPTGGVSAETKTFEIPAINEDVTETVYYIAGLTPYKVMYYKQNIYDDLYTRDNTVSSQYTDRYGYTGSNPTDLEDENMFPGFTNLFHEPDAIAADGSTVFRVYYDRNFYVVNFDLGTGGYGVEPVYAKYESVYHIGEPKRMGYTFMGWLRTDKDSVGLEYAYTDYAITHQLSEDETWRFVDENGNELLDGNGDPLFDEHGEPVDPELNVSQYYFSLTDGKIPAHDTYYKAMWDPGTTRYSVVYWIENPTGHDITADDIQDPEHIHNVDEARALIAQNYTVVAAKDIENVPSGTLVNLDTKIQNAAGQTMKISEFFKYNLSPQAVDVVDGQIVPRTDSSGRPLNKNNQVIDFPAISEAKSAELLGKSAYYTPNEGISHLQFGGVFEEDPEKTHIEVRGDGTTRLNVYFNRRDFTLKFFYAREELDSNGQPNGKISLTNSTKGFTKTAYSGDVYQQALAMESGGDGNWQNEATDTLPQLNPKYTDPNSPDYIPGFEPKYLDYNCTKGNFSGNYRYYYYEVEARYNAPLKGKWLIDAVTKVPKKNKPGENCEPGSWAVEAYTNYYLNHSGNFTVKGIYEKLGDELMYKTKNNTLSELHYLLSWTNSSQSDNGWNYGSNKILHFTYENYIELLPREISKMVDDNNNDGSPDGSQALIDEGLYENIYVRQSDNLYQEVDPSAPFVYDSSKRYYGIKTENRIETTDSGSQYPRNNHNDATIRVYSDQVPTTLSGFELENYRTYTGKETDLPEGLSKYLKKGQVILDTTNTIVDWSDDTNSYRHATIKFFYHRLSYTLKWRNGNRLEEDKTRDVMYQAPLNSVYTQSDGNNQAGDYRYWYNGEPVYFNEDLRDFYSFSGWYYTPYYYRLVDKDTATMPADDITLYAKWDAKKINVSFYPTYNDYYTQENRIACVPNPDYDPEDPGTEPKWIDGDITVEYGDYVPPQQVPVNSNDPNNPRPVLVPPAADAMFAGWYYLRDNVPVRFEPENVPVTALNQEASEHNGSLQLFAEWVTKDVAKYKVTYVEAGTDNVVADPTTGRAFVWKTKTFDAKHGSELNAAHAWTAEGPNWWPVTTSHSIVVKSNAQGNEFAPNEYAFEYIRKQGVFYKVQYLDAVSRAELRPPKTDYSYHASRKEDAPFIPGYIAENLTLTKVLSASANPDPAQQMAEELASNVITFYYHTNDSEYLYEVEYYKQNVQDDGYTLFQTETKTVPIAEAPDISTVSVTDLYNGQFPALFAVNGCTLVNSATEVVNTDIFGAVTTKNVADDELVPITADKKTTIRIYFDRNKYTYRYQYVDSGAERAYLDTPESERGNMWNGVIDTYIGKKDEKVEAEVPIPAPQELTYNDTPYVRIDNKNIVLTIAPDGANSNINLVKIYYRKFFERELRYKLVCQNENDPYTEVDYDPVTGNPLFGGLSGTLQTVEKQEDIQNVVFYNFNDAEKPGAESGGAEKYMHLHRYTFLGWFDNPEGSGTPLTTNTTLTKDDLGLAQNELPKHDTTYYAVVKQDMITATFEFRTVEGDLPGDDTEATAVVDQAPIDATGDKTGSYFNFSSPSTYQNGTPIPWHRTDGFSVSIEPKDNRVYKYEFAEWWEIDFNNNNTLIRHHNWNNSQEGWKPTTLTNQVTRNGDRHIIAVYKRRNVTELPYTLNYRFIARTGEQRTYVKTGVLTGDSLNENSENALITTDGDFRLTDEFILSNAPYESNFGEVLNWTDDPDNIAKTSEKGDSEKGTVDRMMTDVDAAQSVKTVFATYRTTPSGEYTTISIPYSCNYRQSPNMLAIRAEDTDNGKDFAYWEVRKTENGSVIAKSYQPLFDLCMMDSYWITPVYTDTEISDESFITLTHIDNTRNTWTDENNKVPSNGDTDKLYADFEIAFKDGAEDIYTAPEGTYRTGVVFEQCDTLAADEVFDPKEDYPYESNPDNLKAAILEKTAKKYVYGTDASQTRKLQISDIPQSSLTNRDRVQYSKTYRNTYKYEGEEKTYVNARYLLKATAYLVKNGEVTLSNSVYVCLAAEAEKNLAKDSGIVVTSNQG